MPYDALEVGDELAAHRHVQIGSRLVQEQDLRLERERSRQCHTLRFTAGERTDRRVLQVRDAHRLERRPYTGAPRRRRQAPCLQSELDVLGHATAPQVGPLQQRGRRAPELRVVMRHIPSFI